MKTFERDDWNMDTNTRLNIHRLATKDRSALIRGNLRSGAEKVNMTVSIMIWKYSWTIRLKYGSFHEDPIKVLTLNDLQLPFYVLAIGFSISFVVLVAEWILVLYLKCKRE